MTGENDKYNHSKAAHLYPPFSYTPRSAKNYKIALALTVDFTQGLDIRLTTAKNAELIQRVKTQAIHFAWDNPAQDLTEHFRRFKDLSGIKDYRKLGVYVLTNYGDGDSTEEKIENALRRIYPLRDLGYNPYVMIYDKPNAPKQIRMLQRWCNNRMIFRTEPDFYKYSPKIALQRR